MVREMSCSAILRKGAATFAASLMLSACGAGPPDGFANHTRHTDAQLRALWQTAQQNLSQQIDLNPLQRVFQSVAPDIRAGDARVRDIAPRHLAVGSQADVPADELFGATGDLRADPTGLIACPQPCNVHYAAAYSLFSRPTVRYAASWESSESNFDYLLTYEFENQILNALGYDMRWR
jgi:hypothetical protein